MRRSRTSAPAARATSPVAVVGRARSSTAIATGVAASALAAAACGWTGCATASSAPVAPAPAACPTDAVVIASQADITRLASCTMLHGLTIRTGAALDLAKLHGLTTLTGDLVIGPTVAVEDVTLGSLRAVDGAIRVVGNGLLQGAFFPKLERTGAITVDGNVALTTLSLPHVTTIRGALRVSDNSSLELIDIPALTTLDDLIIASDPKLTLIESAELRTLGHLDLDAPRLPSELADRLRSLVH